MPTTMTTTFRESTQPSAAMSIARKLAYRRLAAAIVGLDVESLGLDLQSRREATSADALPDDCCQLAAAG
jgi:hypothetical protein